LYFFTAGSNLIERDTNGNTVFNLALKTLEEYAPHREEKLQVQNLFSRIKGVFLAVKNIYK